MGIVRRHASAPIRRRSVLVGLGAAVCGAIGLALVVRRPAALAVPIGRAIPVPHSGLVSESGAPDGLSEMSRQILALAKKEAAFFQHDQIRTEHILLAIAAVPEAVASRLLRRQGVDPQAVVREVVSHLHIGRWTPGAITLSLSARRSIEVAGLEAQRLGAEVVGTEHLLLGILAERDSLAGRSVARFGVDVAGLRRAAAGLRTG